MSERKVLITGGTGLLGQPLTEQLKADGAEVVLLSRKENLESNPKRYKWNISEGKIDPAAFEGVTDIIHLAGAGVADKRWTESRKQEIIDSRIKSANMLADVIIKNELPIRSFISANAIGIYGDRGEEWLYEASAPEEGWMPELCMAWEEALDPITEWGIRTASLRIGLVLSQSGGALPKLLQGLKFGVNPVLGDGNQYYSWIHVNDLVGIINTVLNDESIIGPVNAVAPNPVSNEVFTKSIQEAAGKSAFNPKVPRFFLQLGMGDMSQVLFDSARVSSDYIQQKGYQFQFDTIETALKDLFS